MNAQTLPDIITSARERYLGETVSINGFSFAVSAVDSFGGVCHLGGMFTAPHMVGGFAGWIPLPLVSCANLAGD